MLVFVFLFFVFLPPVSENVQLRVSTKQKYHHAAWLSRNFASLSTGDYAGTKSRTSLPDEDSSTNDVPTTATHHRESGKVWETASSVPAHERSPGRGTIAVSAVATAVRNGGVRNGGARKRARKRASKRACKEASKEAR